MARQELNAMIRFAIRLAVLIRFKKMEIIKLIITIKLCVLQIVVLLFYN